MRSSLSGLTQTDVTDSGEIYSDRRSIWLTRTDLFLRTDMRVTALDFALGLSGVCVPLSASDPSFIFFAQIE